MTIPAAVVEQGAVADQRLEEEAARLKTARETGGQTPAPAAPPQAPAQPPIGDPATPPPQPAAAPEGKPLEQRYAELQAEHDRERQRYQTVNGKYQAEVPRLSAEIKQLRDELAQVKKVAAEPAAPTVPPHLRYLKANEREEFDDETLGVQARVAKGVAEDSTNTLREELRTRDERLQRLEQSQQQQGENKLWDQVDRLSPGAKEVNDLLSPEYLAFLDKVEAASGRTYRALGIAAINAGDIKRLADLMEEFKTTTGEQGAAQVTSQLRPDVAPSGSPAGPPQKQFMKKSYVDKCFDDIRKGVYTGRDEERARIEKEIDEACFEGRIIEG